MQFKPTDLHQRHPEIFNKENRRISTEATGRGRGMYTPNLFGAMLLSVTQKLGANIPRLALLALAEIHSSRFVALLRMTHVRWCTVPRETPKRAIYCTFSLVRLHKQHTVLFVTLRVTLRSLRSLSITPMPSNHLLRLVFKRCIKGRNRLA